MNKTNKKIKKQVKKDFATYIITYFHDPADKEQIDPARDCLGEGRGLR